MALRVSGLFRGGPGVRQLRGVEGLAESSCNPQQPESIGWSQLPGQMWLSGWSLGRQ